MDGETRLGAGLRPGKRALVLKRGRSVQGMVAIQIAGGTIVGMNKLGIATVTSAKPSFAAEAARIGLCDGCCPRCVVRRPGGTADVLFLARGQRCDPVPAEQAACASLFSLPPLLGPDPLGVCQWDMRAINATPSGSYAVNQGLGARSATSTLASTSRIPISRRTSTSAASCSFIYATTPTSNPAEQVTRGDCSNKAAVQDLNGHGTHTAGTIAAPMNGIGITGVAPKAKLVALKAGTQEGYFFTDSVVDALTYAGDQRLDAVNMSFFADPWLFNCRNDAEQRAIVQAISRAAAYAQQRGVVLVAAAGNDGIDLSHPTVGRDQPRLPARRRRHAAREQQLRRASDRAPGRRRRHRDRRAEPPRRGTRPTGT